MEKIFQTICDKCKNLYNDDGKRYCFKLPIAVKRYEPYEYLKGSQNPEVLIITINPAGPVGSIHTSTKESLKSFNPIVEYSKFYHWYNKMSPRLFLNWSNMSAQKQVVAETDLYKCHSISVDEKLKANLSENCFPFLEKQLKMHSSTLKVIICNGRIVGDKLKEKFKNNLFNEIVFHKEYNISSQDLIVKNFKLKAKIIFCPFIQSRLKAEKRLAIGSIIEQVISGQDIFL